jgi:hypothetical protein
MTEKRTFSEMDAEPSVPVTRSIGVQTVDPQKPTVLLSTRHMVAIDEAIERVLEGLRCNCYPNRLPPHTRTPDLQRAHDDAVWMQRIFDERRAEYGAHALPAVALADLRDRAIVVLRILAIIPHDDAATQALRAIIDTIDDAEGCRRSIPPLEDKIKKETFFRFTLTNPRTCWPWTFLLTMHDLGELRAGARKRIGGACLAVNFHSDAPKGRPHACVNAGYDREDVYKTTFPGGAVFYFEDPGTANGFVHDYKVMAEDEQREVRQPFPTFARDAFSVEMIRIPKYAVVGSYRGTYVPFLEPDFYAELKRDFQRYLARTREK